MDHLNLPSRTTALIHHPSSALRQTSGHPSVAYGFENEEEDSAGGLLEYWRILVRYRGKIFIASLIGLALGFAIGIPMRPKFRAVTTLEVLTLNEDFMNMKQANPTTTSSDGYDTSEEQTQAKLLQGTALQYRTIKKLDPEARGPIKKPRMATSGWRSLLHLSEPIDSTPREILLTKAADSLKVRPAVKTRILELTVDSTDPQLAMDFANTLTTEFIAQSMEARWETNQRTGDWLRRELDDARLKLRKSEVALQAYAQGSGLIFTDETTNVATEKLQQVQLALSAATTERIARQSRFELAQGSPSESLADVLNDGSLRETQAKLNDLKSQIADLTAIYSPEYSKVRRLQAELETLQGAFDKSRNDILNRIKTDFQESTRKENLLAAAYTTQAREVTGQDEKAIQYNILKRDVDSNRQLYDTMLQQVKQASIASAMRSSNVRVVDPAELPDTPISPNFRINSILGLLGGLVLSIAAVTIKERADRTLQQPGDIKMWVDLPELGIIPSASLDNRRSLSYRSQDFSEQSVPTLSGEKKSERIELVTWQKKPSLIAEAFRSALTSILFVAENGNRPRVLVFTSANAADGKTTIVSNVAIAAAEIRMRVLVIDADLRRPRMHNVFNLDNDTGLSDLLRQNVDGISLTALVKKTTVEGLDVITAGPATHAAAHLLYSPIFANALTKLREDYDMILIDTPPMLQMTDARVAGRLADAVILVARSNTTTRDAILAAKERFADDGIKVMGAILNDWNPRRSPGGYYGYYRNSYSSPSQTLG